MIVSDGAGVAVPFFWLGRLFGARTVYLEVYDRIDSATMTGRLVGPTTDLFLVQWDEQLASYPDATSSPGRCTELADATLRQRRHRPPSVRPTRRLGRRWAAAHPEDTVVVQHGTTRPPTGGRAAELFRRDEMRAQIESADVVVISCGPGGVMDVRATGRRPIVVARRARPRRARRRSSAGLRSAPGPTGLAVCVETEQEFAEALEDARAHPGDGGSQPDSHGTVGDRPHRCS